MGTVYLFRGARKESLTKQVNCPPKLASARPHHANTSKERPDGCSGRPQSPAYVRQLTRDTDVRSRRFGAAVDRCTQQACRVLRLCAHNRLSGPRLASATHFRSCKRWNLAHRRDRGLRSGRIRCSRHWSRRRRRRHFHCRFPDSGGNRGPQVPSFFSNVDTKPDDGDSSLASRLPEGVLRTTSELSPNSQFTASARGIPRRGRPCSSRRPGSAARRRRKSAGSSDPSNSA